jgi:alpha-L-fucosidase 2
MFISSLQVSIYRTPVGGAMEGSPLTLWYRSPAKVWKREALPLGNGNLGAMVFGGIESERIQLNEHSLRSGHHVEDDNAGTIELLAQIRKLLFEGKFAEANAVGRSAVGGPSRPGVRSSYQTLGGRYLLMSSSRPGTLPENLQDILADGLNPP